MVSSLPIYGIKKGTYFLEIFNSTIRNPYGIIYFDTIYNMTYTKPLHTFHIPVMGLAFTIDSPLRVAHYGIDSVISIMDDDLIERMNAFYSEKFKQPYKEITQK